MAYIMVEGAEGAGKTEGVARLASDLKVAGYDVLEVHEPGNGTLGTLVRSTLSGIKKDHHERIKSYFRDKSETEQLLEHLINNAQYNEDSLKTIKEDYAAIKSMVRKDSTFDRLLGALTVAKEIDVESLQLLFTAVRSEDMKRLAPFLAKKNMAIVSDRGYPSTITYAESNGPNPEYVKFLKSINSRFPKPDLMVVLTAPPEVLLSRVQNRGGPEERFDRLETIKNIDESYKRNYPEAIYIDASQSREKIHTELLEHSISTLKRLDVKPVYKKSRV
ncbi:MAG: thymidylate kinase [Candidatus Marsarchaeota archaeon]|nr:thymidylate kinase [Candidatus Marsarchaeota archaeon]